MSTVSVHGPSMWGYATLTESDHVVVHVLSENKLEFKAKTASDLGAAEDPYVWDFGDGTQVVNGRYVSHTFATPGTFVVTLDIETTQEPITDEVTVTLGGNGHRTAAEEEREEQHPLKAA
jgi:hypothetical protein